MYELIPAELKSLKNWVCWQAVPDAKSHSGISKIPINPNTRGKAKSNDSDTWADFDTAVRIAQDYAGIGFMFSDSDYFGVDLDDCKDDIEAYKNGEKAGFIGEFVESLRSYAELSQSGNGIHIICKGELPPNGRRHGKVEMYESGRFFVMTGNCFSDYCECNECTESIKPLHKKYISSTTSAKDDFMDVLTPVSLTNASEIINKAMSAKNGDKFSALYSGDITGYASQSEADMAFMNMLAFWCTCDRSLMDEIYRSSGLFRDKWDRKQSGSTYGELTISKAIEQCDEMYTENRYEDSYSIKIEKSNPLKMYKFDDTGNAQRLFENFGDILRYNYIDKRWMYYDGGKWRTDNVGFARKVADASTTILEREHVLYDEDDDLKKAYERHLKKSRSFTGKTNMLHEAEHYSPIEPHVLDRDINIIGVKNGILNLSTMEMSPHSKDAFITKLANADFDYNAAEPKRWKSFLFEIFGGDEKLIRYVQKCAGYSLTGSIEEQCVFFLFGSGCNGKSTFIDVIRNLAGDYAMNIQPQTIMVNNKSSGSPNSDIARLKGARLVTTVEPDEGARLAEGLIKQLTGGDPVTARKLFGDEFEFNPVFKLWMATNHKPVIRGTDPGIWRRIHLIPFTIQIPEDKRDKRLIYKLMEESDGIFKWMIDGCKMWQSEGLEMPGAVLEAVKEYKNEMDVISCFISNRCIVGKGEVKASTLYNAYAAWADANSEFKMSNTRFGREMVKRPGVEKVKKSDGMYYTGLSLDGGIIVNYL